MTTTSTATAKKNKTTTKKSKATATTAAAPDSGTVLTEGASANGSTENSDMNTATDTDTSTADLLGLSEPKLTPEEAKAAKRAMFQHTLTLKTEIAEGRAALKAKEVELSNAIGAISLKHGKGPFNWNGGIVNIVERDGGFFWREHKAEIESI